jgi:hypothetical protein
MKQRHRRKLTRPTQFGRWWRNLALRKIFRSMSETLAFYSHPR